MQCAELPSNALVPSVTSYTLQLQSPLNTFLFVPYNGSFMIKLSIVKAHLSEFTAVRLFAAVGFFYFGVFLNFPLKLLSFTFKPSMCSNKFSFIFAAGTKSLSPAMRII